MNSPTNTRARFISPSKQTIGHYLGPVSRLTRHILFKKFENFEVGMLVVHENGQQWRFGNKCKQQSHHLYVHHPKFYSSVVLGGSLGAAESYIQGEWSTDDLTGLLRFFLENAHTLKRLDAGFGKILVPVHKAYHKLHPNTIKGSRANIVAHYDLGNDFFTNFLDPSMMYSCAYFERSNTTLEEASIAKIDRICRKLALSPHEHVVEIGSGWGAFAVHAAQKYGCSVTTTTLSREQYRMTCDRVKQEGVDDRVTVMMADYRKLNGVFDKLVSIEMIEAVGWQHYPEYFSTCSRLLKSDGRMLIQSIVIQDQLYERAKRHVDFIKRYIFPGGCLPSITNLCTTATTYTDLQIINLEGITNHYIQTLTEWRKRFNRARNYYRSRGFSDAMMRMWNYYFCYSIAGFAEGRIGTIQMMFAKPTRRPLRAESLKGGG